VCVLGAAVTDRDGMNVGAVGAEMTVDLPAATQPSTMTTSSDAGNSDLEMTVDLPTATEPSTMTTSSHAGNSDPEMTVDMPAATELSVTPAARASGLQVTVSQTAEYDLETAAGSTSFREFIHIPTKSPSASDTTNASRKRKVGHACVISASPHKKALELKKEAMQKKEERKNKRMQATKVTKSQGKEERKNKEQMQNTKGTKNKGKKPKVTKGRPKTQKKKNQCMSDASNSKENESDCECLYCGCLYSQSSEDFVACQGECGEWAHVGCANVSASGQFVCEVCAD